MAHTLYLIGSIDIIIKIDCNFIDGINKCMYLSMFMVLPLAVRGEGFTKKACNDTVDIEILWDFRRDIQFE